MTVPLPFLLHTHTHMHTPVFHCTVCVLPYRQSGTWDSTEMQSSGSTTPRSPRALEMLPNPSLTTWMWALHSLLPRLLPNILNATIAFQAPHSVHNNGPFLWPLHNMAMCDKPGEEPWDKARLQFFNITYSTKSLIQTSLMIYLSKPHKLCSFYCEM